MRSVLILLAVCLLSACGQKGPLFLPEDSSELADHVSEARKSSNQGEQR